MHSKKEQSEESLIGRAVKSSIQKLYDKGLFENYVNADKKLKDCLRIERSRPILEELNEDVNQWFYS